MKKLKSLIVLMLPITVVSCLKSDIVHEGCVDFTVSTDQFLTDVTKSNVSDFAALPVPEDFTIAVTNADGASIWSGKSSEWDSAAKIKVGEYTVEAVAGNLEEEGFGKPCFAGTRTFVVKDKETSEVEIPVSLANTVIKITCTENLKNYYKDYSFRLERNNTEIVTFAKDETRAAFIDGYKITVTGVFTAESGSEKAFSKEYTNLAPATAYNMIFDVAGTGSGAVEISFNNNVETVELGDVELND